MVTYSGLVTPYGDRDLVYIGSGNGLLPGGTKPLPEPMLTGHQWSPLTFISLRTISQEMPQPLINKICLKTKISFKFPRGQWVKVTAWIVLFREERFVEPWIRQTHNPRYSIGNLSVTPVRKGEQWWLLCHSPFQLGNYFTLSTRSYAKQVSFHCTANTWRNDYVISKWKRRCDVVLV